MRVTIGERLGLPPKGTTPPRPEGRREDGVPSHVEPERAGPVLRLDRCPSKRDEPCRTPGAYCPGCPCPYCSRRDRERGRMETEPLLGPPRVTGEMVWTHKTAPILVIHGRDVIDPEEYAANRRR